MNHKEFAASIKAKYPQYADMPDEELARAMMEKFPVYSDVDTTGMSAPPAQYLGAPAETFMSPADKFRMKKAEIAQKLASGVFETARGAIAGPLSVAEGAVRVTGDWLGDQAKKVNPIAELTGLSGKWAPEGFSGAVKNAWQGRKEGVRGFGSNPLNALALIPALAPERLAALAPEMLNTAGVVPKVLGNRWMQRGLSTAIGAGQGGLMGAVDAAANPQDNTSVGRSAAIGALTGGLGQGIASGLKAYGGSKFPGMSNAYNRNVTPEAKALIAQNLDQIMSPGILPKGREGFLSLADQMKGQIGKRYAAATEAVPKDWTYPVEDLWQNTERNLKGEMGRLGGAGLELKPGVSAPVLPGQAQEAVDEGIRHVMANQLHNQLPEDVLTASQLGAHRSMLVNPKTYTNPQTAAPIMQKNVGEAFHSGITDALMSAPNYAATLGAKTPKEYALWKSVEQLINHPGNVGLAHRLPILNTAVSHWYWPSSIYKAGQATGKASRFAPYLIPQGPDSAGQQ